MMRTGKDINSCVNQVKILWGVGMALGGSVKVTGGEEKTSTFAYGWKRSFESGIGKRVK